MSRFHRIVAALAIVPTSTAFGQVWVEVDDAPVLLPETPSQTTIGFGALTRIDGVVHHAFQPGPDDFDSYLIRITDPEQFSAQISGGTGPYNQEWLFTSDLLGVVHNDAGSLPGSFVPAPGLYHIGVSFGNYWRALGPGGLELWGIGPLPAAPNGPGAGSPLDNWSVTLIGFSGPPVPYTIDLTGAAFAEEPACYPDCTTDAQLTVADFACFQTRFVAGDPYADCNGGGGLTVGDFACFQTAFVAGCP
jgi:hypothetical protein